MTATSALRARDRARARGGAARQPSRGSRATRSGGRRRSACRPAQLRPDLYTTLGQSYAALGAPDRAVRLFEALLRRGEPGGSGRLSRADPLRDVPQLRVADAGEYERAGEVVREALWHAPTSRRIRTRACACTGHSARLARVEGKSAEALTHIRSAIALLKATDDSLDAGARLPPRGRRRAEEPLDRDARQNLAARGAAPGSSTGARGPRNVADRSVAARRASKATVRRRWRTHATRSHSSATSTETSRGAAGARAGEGPGAAGRHDRRRRRLPPRRRPARGSRPARNAGEAALEWARSCRSRGARRKRSRSSAARTISA